jgi:hypothetical protein
MSDYAGHQRPEDIVPHQDEQEELVDAQLVATSDHAAIADLGAPSSTYVEAEAIAMTGKINEILDVLRDAGLVPPNA